jgi:hypothetical protein
MLEMRTPFRAWRARLAVRSRQAFFPAFPALLACFAAGACTDVAARNPPPRGSLGEELYGVMCDRVGGQSLHEDLTGASFHGICHKVDGSFANKVDQSRLPTLVDNQPDIDGKPVPLSTQQTQRAYGVARLERLAGNRDRLVAALDAGFPDIQVPVKDTGNSDPTRSCNASPAGGGQGSLHTELANLLSRFTALYDDGTLPRSTEALGGLVSVYNASADPGTGAQASWARLNARAGYRPAGIALGALRPLLAYPNLRGMTNDVLRLLSPDSDPYNPSPQHDAQGNRVPVPGAAYTPMSNLSAALAFELGNEVDDPVPSPLVLPVTHDAMVGGRSVLGRPRSDLELLTSIFFAEDPSFASGLGSPAYVVRRDPRGFVALAAPAAAPAVPAPFVDEGDGLPALDPVTGQFKTMGGSPAPSPFLAPGAPDAPSRDAAGRAQGAGGALVYGYVDTAQTFEARFLAHLRGVVTGKSLVDSNPADNHETLMNMLAGAQVLFGARAPASKSYGSQTLAYSGFQAAHSPLGDLLYAISQVLADPTTDSTLAFTSALMKSNPSDVARVVGDTLWAKDQANADTSAKLPAKSTFWDEMIDVLVAIAQDSSTSTDPNGKRLLEDILTAFAQPASAGLAKAVATQAANVDVMTYDRNNLNGPPVNVTKPGSPPSTPADHTKPDTGANRSQLQRFAQLVHDTDGVTLCNKEGAVIHGAGIALLGNSNVCASTGGNIGQLCCNTLGPTCLTPDTSCTCANGRLFHECEVFKIDNLAGFYLDSLARKANLYFRNKLLRDGLGGAVPDGGLPDGAAQNGPAGLGAATVGVNETSSGIGLHLDGGSADDTYNDTDAGTTGPSAPGFWDPAGTVWNAFASPPTLLRPKPAWLNRLAGFDLVHDSPTPATLPATNNYVTNHFIADLQGNSIGTTACPERVIADPCANDPNCFDRQADRDANVASDGMVHGLRACQDGDWLYQRDADSFFLTEEGGFLDALTPLATAFANHGREDLFIQVMETLHKHWQTAAGAAASAAECKLTPTTNCTKDGADTYEPLFAKIFSADLMTALNKITGIAAGMTVQTCVAVDPRTHACTMPGSTDGISLLASATRALADPKVAQSFGVTDSAGKVTSVRNDGATNAQVTPLYLILEALNEIDAAFAPTTPADPDPNRLTEWRSARSQLVDELLGVKNANMPAMTATFADAALPKITPVLVDAVRAQVLARCGTDSTTGKCKWARGAVRTPILTPPSKPTDPPVPLWNEAITTLSGPTFAAIMDLLEALRRDPKARAAQEDLLAYLVDPKSTDAVGQVEAFAELLSSSHDILQNLNDGQNLYTPLYKVLSSAFAAPPSAPKGPSVIDSTTALMTRLAGHAVDPGGHELCSNEVDPNDVVSVALAHLVTPMPLPGCTPSAQNPCLSESPLEVIVDAVADVNRAPDSASSLLLTPADYGNISNEIVEFALDPQRGLEQFYEVVRLGTQN